MAPPETLSLGGSTEFTPIIEHLQIDSLLIHNPQAHVIDEESLRVFEKNFAPAMFDPIKHVTVQSITGEQWSAIIDGHTRFIYAYQHQDRFPHGIPACNVTGSYCTDAQKDYLTPAEYLAAVMSEPTGTRKKINPLRLAAHLTHYWPHIVGQETHKQFSAFAAVQHIIASEKWRIKRVPDYLSFEAVQQVASGIEVIDSVMALEGVHFKEKTLLDAFITLMKRNPLALGGEEGVLHELGGLLSHPKVIQKIQDSAKSSTEAQGQVYRDLQLALRSSFEKRANLTNGVGDIIEMLRDPQLTLDETMRALQDYRTLGWRPTAREKILAAKKSPALLTACTQITQDSALAQQIHNTLLPYIHYIQEPHLPIVVQSTMQRIIKTDQINRVIDHVEKLGSVFDMPESWMGNSIQRLQRITKQLKDFRMVYAPQNVEEVLQEADRCVGDIERELIDTIAWPSLWEEIKQHIAPHLPTTLSENIIDEAANIIMECVYSTRYPTVDARTRDITASSISAILTEVATHYTTGSIEEDSAKRVFIELLLHVITTQRKKRATPGN